ncbi:hypothetical protein RS130_09915 [Paraglaciecola aquimarina]|uniref:Uncharacterized protein n=1 Tax=Paraglaciecola aquimarina TaxID=1235557 RepID=A0ABU3SW11_9ALTE|nr:hypothetical protein [Paraglaciecola aquimarina]MDU0354208.1 hypothetical protein [Paraglaciecola aquimarina]
MLTLIKQIEKQDVIKLNRARAIQYLALVEGQHPTVRLENLVAKTQDTIEVLYILNIATQLKDSLGYDFNIPFRKEWNKAGREIKDSAKRWRQDTISNWFTARVDYLKAK